MIILDTNVLSELISPAINPQVRAWFSGQDGSDLWVTSLTVSEIFYGVFRLEHGMRREALEDAISAVLFDDYEGRILPFDDEAAIHHGRLRARLRREGRPAQDGDALIASIALAKDATIATRNIRDFRNCGVDLVDPWAV